MEENERKLLPIKNLEQPSKYSKKSSWKKILFLFLFFTAILVGCVLFPPAGIVLLGIAISKVAVVIMGTVASLVLWVLFLRVGSSRCDKETHDPHINHELVRRAQGNHNSGEKKQGPSIESQFNAAFKAALNYTDLDTGYGNGLAMVTELLRSNAISLVGIYENAGYNESRTYLEAALKAGFPALTKLLLNYLVSEKKEEGFLVPVHSIEDLEKAANIITPFLEEYKGSPEKRNEITEKLRETRLLIFNHYFNLKRTGNKLSDEQEDLLSDLLGMEDLELAEAALNSFLFVQIIRASDDSDEDFEEAKEVYSYFSEYQTGFLEGVFDLVCKFVSSDGSVSLYNIFLLNFCNKIDELLRERKEAQRRDHSFPGVSLFRTNGEKMNIYGHRDGDEEEQGGLEDFFSSYIFPPKLNKDEAESDESLTGSDEESDEEAEVYRK